MGGVLKLRGLRGYIDGIDAWMVGWMVLMGAFQSEKGLKSQSKGANSCERIEESEGKMKEK